VLRHAPAAVAALSSFVVLWEIYFPVLVWNKALKPWVLGTGVALHAFIGSVMSLPFFSWFMVAAYALFVDPRRLERLLGGGLRKGRAGSPAAARNEAPAS